MWIMTHFGILMPSLRPEDTVLPGDNRLIQIRARRAKDLNYLRDHYAPYLGATLFIGDTDYQYRAYCTHRELADITSQLALEIDYVKFKPTTDRHNDKPLHDLYNRIWSDVLDAFEVGSSYARPKYQAPKPPQDRRSRKQRRADRKAAQRNGTGWKNAWVDEVDEGTINVNGDRNEYADANRGFRKHWWEDVDAAN
jgi:hypothetical protein